MKPKIIMFSDLYLPTFPYLEIPMYKYLSDYIEVQYVLQNGDIRLTDKNLSKTFTSLNLRTISSPKNLYKLMNKNDLLLMRFAYKLMGGKVAEIIKSKGYKILMYDPSGIDIRVRQCPAQYLTSKSEKLKQMTLKKFPKYYKQIFVTGTIHNDAVATTRVNRTKFMKSYGLNPAKKLAILVPANPGEGYMKGISDEYKNIINLVRKYCPDYEIVVKGHPLDYTASMKMQPGIIHKNEHYDGKHSWEHFAPRITVIKAEEGYMALKASDVILNVRSSIAMETALFEKPLININRFKYITNWPFDSKIMYDIKMSELVSILNNDNYSVDKNSCLNYCKREAYSNDGKAYIRTSEVAIKILDKI